jgi:hypothetical protein
MLVALLACTAQQSKASSDDAWAAFRTDVRAKCTAAAKSVLSNPVAVVDPFGSESYGIAVVYGRPLPGKGMAAPNVAASVVCVYDKKTKKVELSGIIESNFVTH